MMCVVPTRYDARFFIVGSQQAPRGRRPPAHRKLLADRYRRLPFRTLSNTVRLQASRGMQIAVAGITLVCASLNVVLWVGTPVAGAFIAAGGGAGRIIPGALIALVGPSVGQYAYAKSWWRYPMVLNLLGNRCLNGFPGDQQLIFNIEAVDGQRVVETLEAAGFWNVRAAVLDCPNGRWDAELLASLNVAQDNASVQRAADALNAAEIPFWFKSAGAA